MSRLEYVTQKEAHTGPSLDTKLVDILRLFSHPHLKISEK